MGKLIAGAPLASLLWLGAAACGHGGATPAQSSAKGCHSPTAAAAPAKPVAAPAPAPTPVTAQPPAPAPPPAPVAVQPATLPPPKRPYEPPMPLEPGKATSVSQPIPASANGPNT